MASDYFRKMCVRLRIWGWIRQDITLPNFPMTYKFLTCPIGNQSILELWFASYVRERWIFLDLLHIVGMRKEHELTHPYAFILILLPWSLNTEWTSTCIEAFRWITHIGASWWSYNIQSRNSKRKRELTDIYAPLLLSWCLNILCYLPNSSRLSVVTPVTKMRVEPEQTRACWTIALGYK